MSDEQTPLLSDSVMPSPSDVDLETERELAHLAVYSRFSEKKKALIVFLVSWAGLIPCASHLPVVGAYYATHTCIITDRYPPVFVSGSFVPSIPQIARDFDTTGAVVKYVPSVSRAVQHPLTISTFTVWQLACQYWQVPSAV